MNQIEAVKYLASVNAGKLYPKNLEEIDKTIPYFNIKKNNAGKYYTENFGHFGHDNEGRMQYVTNYLTSNVFPNIKTDITGYYSIQLHDSYTYLNDDKNYKDVLTFSKFKYDNGSILIPDIYMLSNWQGQLSNIQDPFKKWEEKNRKICFFGTTTGSKNPLNNLRINTCLWAINKRQFCDSYITNVAQMELNNIVEKIPNFKDIYIKPVSIQEQYKYAYQLILDGNTCPFHCNNYFMNSLTFKYKSNEILWYYPILQHKSHFVRVDTDTIENEFRYYENNKKEAEYIIYNANQFAKTMFKPIICQQYLVSLFETIGSNK
jgi:hypothetical protein